MKTIIGLLIALLFTVNLIGQTPQKMSYQAVVRDANNKLIQNKEVGVQISILTNTATGKVIYKETHKATTNSNGLFTIIIGDGTTTSKLSDINWALGNYFLKVETDPEGGSDYSISGTNRILSVPYALHTQSANQLAPSKVVPRIASRNQRLSVTFSGGNQFEFSQATNSCPKVYPYAILEFRQGSKTYSIHPKDTYYISPERFDAVYDIPYYVPTGKYNIIIAPNSNCPRVYEEEFKVIY